MNEQTLNILMMFLVFMVANILVRAVFKIVWPENKCSEKMQLQIEAQVELIVSQKKTIELLKKQLNMIVK